MNSRLLTLTALVCLVPSLPCAAVDPSKADPAAANPAFANPDTPGLLAGKPGEAANVSDLVFLQQLAIGGHAELSLAKLAESRSSTAAVDAFARRMQADHEAANAKLAAVARTAKAEAPETLDAEHLAAQQELEGLHGQDFDRKYVDGQIKDHQKAAQLLIYEIGSGQHTAVRQFASDTLPTVMAHLEQAQALHAQLTGAAPSAGPLAP
ncbi:MAG TPA: DUF4142 domain-containing protein [Gammaproteobacteria bacterium]|nr:DUF4142 domain-containing protein [Gammaproteobacteria bacterium]